MLRAWSKRIALCIPIIGVMAATAPPVAHGQRLGGIETSNKRVKTLYLDGEYASATPCLADIGAANSSRQVKSIPLPSANLATLTSAGPLQGAEGSTATRWGGSASSDLNALTVKSVTDRRSLSRSMTIL